MAINKPAPGTLLDATHPLRAVLAHFWPFWEGAGVTVHDIIDATKDATIAGTEIAWTTDVQGQCVLSSAAITTAASRLEVPGVVFGPAPCTMEFKIRGLGLQPTGTFHYSVVFANVWGTAGMLAWNNGYSAYGMGGDSPIVTPTALHHVFLVVAADGKETWYVDGVKTVKTDTFTQRTLTRMMNDDNNEYFKAQFEFMRLWSRALTDIEVASLTADPYQVFVQPENNQPMIFVTT